MKGFLELARGGVLKVTGTPEYGINPENYHKKWWVHLTFDDTFPPAIDLVGERVLYMNPEEPLIGEGIISRFGVDLATGVATATVTCQGRPLTFPIGIETAMRDLVAKMQEDPFKRWEGYIHVPIRR